MKTKSYYYFLLVFIFSLNSFSQNDSWSKTSFKERTSGITLKNLDSNNSEVLQLDIERFKQRLIGAPLRSTSNGKSNTIVNFPNVDGKMMQFRVVETSIFSSDENQHPNIKTYLGSRTDNSGTRVRFSVTPLGLKGMISEPGKETVFIQPVTKVSNGKYLIYNKIARLNSADTFECLTEGIDITKRKENISTYRNANDQLLRTYRIAISVNQEYTNFWDDGNAGNGDNRADALAQVVSTLNRMNEVFEVDMAITFVLVDTVDDPALDLIYSPTFPDPYTGSFNSELQTNLTTTVGEADYDIGHLFVYATSTNGNAGCIGCVCVDGTKGSGFSQHPFTDNNGGPYMSDFFDIDYVSHEVGHQLGANHTFSFASEVTGVNVEPGSGTTIMGYAGISGVDDVQDHSDTYFHYLSINQILNNIADVPNNCAVTTTIINNPPVANAGSNYTIPNGTAFVLKAAATDADVTDVLTYCWEQIDDGVTTSDNFGPTKTAGALWRSRPPSTSPNRYMPIFGRVLSGQLTETDPVETVDNSSWETVSTVARTLNFALTVRDRSEAGGVGQTPQTDSDTMVVNIEGGEPFTVVTPLILGSGSTQNISWNVGASNVMPINCQTVTIKLSTDGGVTFPTILIAATENDGSESINIPSIPDTNTARILVEADDNIFYAVSSNFPISSAPTFAFSNTSGAQAICNLDTVSFDINFFTIKGFRETTTFSASSNLTGSTVTFTPSTLDTEGVTVMTIAGLIGATAGDYTITVTGTSASQIKTEDVMLTIIDGLCTSVGDTVYNTSTTLVQFGAINNTSGKPSGYSDYLAISTEVTHGESYPITVNQNTDGDFTCVSTVWIDWNQNCEFDTNETYDLGTATDTPDGPASNSRLEITVPVDAVVGNTIMRVTTKYDSAADSCENEHDAEVEDYTVNVLVPVALEEEFSSVISFNIYPNPNNGTFNVSLNSSSVNGVEISVFDIKERIVYTKHYPSRPDFNETINLKAVRAGLYILQVSDGVNTHAKKIIVN